MISRSSCEVLKIKYCMGWSLGATQGKIFQQFKSFEGVTSDEFGDLKITGKVGDYYSIYYDSLCDSTTQVKVAYYINEFSINAIEEENMQFVTFGVTNFEFTGNMSHGNALSLDIKVGLTHLKCRKSNIV